MASEPQTTRALWSYTFIGKDHPANWKWIGSIDVADPADVNWARDRGYRIGEIYDGLSGSVAEPCCADIYKEVVNQDDQP